MNNDLSIVYAKMQLIVLLGSCPKPGIILTSSKNKYKRVFLKICRSKENCILVAGEIIGNRCKERLGFVLSTVEA